MDFSSLLGEIPVVGCRAYSVISVMQGATNAHYSSVTSPEYTRRCFPSMTPFYHVAFDSLHSDPDRHARAA
jgi:hypothetical protein